MWRWPWGQAPFHHKSSVLCSAPRCPAGVLSTSFALLVCSCLLHSTLSSKMSLVFQGQPEREAASSLQKGKWAWSPEWSWLMQREIPTLVSDCSVFMQRRMPKSCNSIGPKELFWLVRRKMFWLAQDADGDIVAQLHQMGKIIVLLVEIQL